MIYDFTQTKKSCHCERGPGGAGTEPNLTIILTILFTHIRHNQPRCSSVRVAARGTARRKQEQKGGFGSFVEMQETENKDLGAFLASCLAESSTTGQAQSGTIPSPGIAV